jgi:hypothetical protein
MPFSPCMVGLGDINANVALAAGLLHSKGFRTQTTVEMGSRVHPACGFSMLLYRLGLLIPLYRLLVPVLEHDWCDQCFLHCQLACIIWQ